MNRAILPDARESRLPNWVRNELAALRYSVRELEVKNAELRYEIPNTRVHIRDYGSTDRPLPDDSKVVFTFDPLATRGTDVIAWFNDRNQLVIQGDRTLNIIPQASNTLCVEIRD